MTYCPAFRTKTASSHETISFVSNICLALCTFSYLECLTSKSPESHATRNVFSPRDITEENGQWNALYSRNWKSSISRPDHQLGGFLHPFWFFSVFLVYFRHGKSTIRRVRIVARPGSWLAVLDCLDRKTEHEDFHCLPPIYFFLSTLFFA